MPDDDLRDLADAAGLSSRWTDAFGVTQAVGIDTLRSTLEALGLPCGSAAAIQDSLAALDGSAGLPPLLTADAGSTIAVPGAVDGARVVIKLENGERVEQDATVGPDGRVHVAVPDAPGYGTLESGREECILAIAPRSCFTLADALRRSGQGRDRAWGLAAQLYSLRRRGDGGLGDVGALSRLAEQAAVHGADALSISPVHAQFSADPDRFSPYAPSSRVARNVLHAAIDFSGETHATLEAAELVDWPQAGRLRLAALRAEWEATGRRDPGFADWHAASDESVELHARFETLHAAQFAAGRGFWHWRDWPAGFRDHTSDAVAEFAAAHAEDVSFHAWMQYRIECGLEDAQRTARRAGMAVGLVSDLAVGADSGGSHCWSRPAETLLGLTIGAPPDLLARDGQNWGITAFSPRGLRAHGFRAFVEMVRAALRSAGGVRIDHAMGLNRLWVVPDGHPASLGTYLAMPETDLLRLLRLESRRHEAIVLAENLGTVPEGFSDRLRDAGIAGMSVLWFQRDEGKRFLSPSQWPRHASAMTSTHDLPTVAGWWRGRDIEWNERLGRDVGDARAERARDRDQLWDAMQHAGVSQGAQPAHWDAYRIADAAVGFLGRSSSELVMLPLEDALAVEEAPNLPGTTDEHPNWRRRLPGTVETLLDTGHVGERLDILDEARHRP